MIEIAVIPNTEYDLYAWVRGELDAEASEGGSWLVQAVFFNASGGELGYQDVASGAAGSLNTAWAQKGGRFTTPTGAFKLRVAFYNYLNSGWAAFDDVTLTRRAETRYYHLGGQRVALHIGNDGGGVVQYLCIDHLGSTTLPTDAASAAVPNSRTWYKPYGEIRAGGSSLPTDRRYTSQIEDAAIGLYFYNARYYDPLLGRFVSADTVVPEPGNPQALNRFAYVLGNPLRYTDPTGHLSEEEIMRLFGLDPKVSTWDDVLAHFEEGGDMEGHWGYLAVLRDFVPGCNLEVWWHDVHVGSETYWTDGYSAEHLLALGRHPATKYSLFNMAEGGQPDHRIWYDAARQYRVLKFDPSKVDRLDAGVDILGISGDLLKGAGPLGLIVFVASEAAEIFTIGKSWDQLEMGDPSGVILDITEPIVDTLRPWPNWGILFNSISLALNFGSAVYYGP